MLPVESPFKTYTDVDGKPLESGYIYFGVANQNPITSPITVYWDAAGTQPAAQPIRTVGGYLVRTNTSTPANVFCDVAYSELVQDHKGRQVFFARTSASFSIAAYVLAFVASLAASAGASLIGFIQAGAGAVLRTLQSKVREISVSVTDFMTDAERADCLTGSPVMDVTAAFMAAIAVADVVDIPAGTYLVGNIKINKNNFTLRGAGYNRTELRAKASADISLEVATTSSVTFLVLEDFKLQGNVTALGGIKLGSSDAFYCAGAMLNRVGVWDYSRTAGTNGFGIQLACVQNMSIHNCWVYRNRHQYQRLQGTGYATSAQITGKSGYAGGGYIGFYIDSQIDDLYIDDIVIEGNDNSAVVVTANAVAVGRGSSIYVNGAYFEANNASGAGVIFVTGNASAYQEHVLVIDRCNFAVNTGTYAALDRVIAAIKNNKLAPAQVVTTANTSVYFENNRYPSAADYLTTYRALLGNITVRDTNDPATGTTPNQINLVNAITFPATQRPVDDPYTMGDFRTLDWTPVLSSDGVAPTYTNVDAATGTYTKVGNLVFARCVVRANISAIGSGTPRVTGLPFASKGLEPPVIGLSSALTTVAGTEYVVTGPAVVFNGAAYVVSTDCYLVFTVTYQTQ